MAMRQESLRAIEEKEAKAIEVGTSGQMAGSSQN
jgi:hypothetical protein